MNICSRRETLKSQLEHHWKMQPVDCMNACSDVGTLCPQLVWTLSVLCGADMCWGFVYDRPKRSGEDGTSARTESEYAAVTTPTADVCVDCMVL